MISHKKTVPIHWWHFSLFSTMELHRSHPGPARLQACANDIGGEFPTMGHERSWLSDRRYPWYVWHISDMVDSMVYYIYMHILWYDRVKPNCMLYFDGFLLRFYRFTVDTDHQFTILIQRSIYSKELGDLGDVMTWECPNDLRNLSKISIYWG